MTKPSGDVSFSQYAGLRDGRPVVVKYVRGETPFPTVQRAWAAAGLAPQVL